VRFGRITQDDIPNMFQEMAANGGGWIHSVPLSRDQLAHLLNNQFVVIDMENGMWIVLSQHEQRQIITNAIDRYSQSVNQPSQTKEMDK